MKKFLVLFLLCLLPLTSHAKIYILIDEASSQKFPIAVPEFLTVNGHANALTRQITTIARNDMDIAGIFKVLDEASFVKADTDTDTIDFSKWTSIGAMALIK